MVTVDPSLPSLLNAADLPSPHPDLSMVMSRELVGAGFHRTLLTQVEQVTSQSNHIPDPSALRVVLIENVTCDMYVDVDQVWKMKYFSACMGESHVCDLLFVCRCLFSLILVGQI